MRLMSANRETRDGLVPIKLNSRWSDLLEGGKTCLIAVAALSACAIAFLLAAPFLIAYFVFLAALGTIGIVAALITHRSGPYIIVSATICFAFWVFWSMFNTWMKIGGL